MYYHVRNWVSLFCSRAGPEPFLPETSSYPNHTGYTLKEISKQARELERQYATTPRHQRQALEVTNEEREAILAELTAEANLLPGHTNIPQDKGTLYALKHLVAQAHIADAKGYPKLESYNQSRAGTKLVQDNTMRVICEYSGLTDCELGCGVHNVLIIDRGDGSNLVEIDSLDFQRSRKPNGSGLTEEYWPTVSLDEEYWPGQHFHLSERLGRCGYCGDAISEPGVTTDDVAEGSNSEGSPHTCQYQHNHQPTSVEFL